MPAPISSNGQPTDQQREDISIENAMNSVTALANSQYRFYDRIQRMFLDRRRDIGDECGYPPTEELNAQSYKDIYNREPIAAKVVDIYPNHSWSVQPQLCENDDEENLTEFEQRWSDIGRTLNGPGFFDEEGETGNPLWEVLKRADKLAGIGHYGALLIGLNDGKPLSDPADFVIPIDKQTQFSDFDPKIVRGKKGVEPLFLTPLDETMAEVSQLETNERHYRCGLPNMYSVTLDDLTPITSSTGRSGASTRTRTLNVHWSRIVHLIPQKESSEVFGKARMRTTYNRLYDLFKLYGGSAEMFWLSAFFGIAFETHPQLGPNVKIDEASMKDQMEKFSNTLQRWLAMPGVTTKTLAPQVSDPTAHIDAQLEAIAVDIECPKRILLGSERGELSSSQDERKWTGTIQDDRTSRVTPNIIVPVVDRFIMLGIMPEPESYKVKWPEEDNLTPQEKTEIANKKTEALAKYVQGDVEQVMTLFDYLTKVWDFTTEEAQEIIDNRMEEEDNFTQGDEEAEPFPLGEGLPDEFMTPEQEDQEPIPGFMAPEDGDKVPVSADSN